MNVPKCPKCGASMLCSKQENNGKHHCQCLKCGYEINIPEKKRIKIPFNFEKAISGKYEVVTRNNLPAKFCRKFEEDTSIWIINGVCSIIYNDGKANHSGIDTDIDLYLLDNAPELTNFEIELANILYENSIITENYEESYEIIKKYTDRLLSKLNGS